VSSLRRLFLVLVASGMCGMTASRGTGARRCLRFQSVPRTVDLAPLISACDKPLTYEATVEVRAGSTLRRGWLLVDGSRFRLGKHYNFSYMSRPPTWYEFHDGKSGMVWEYRVDRRAGWAMPFLGKRLRPSIRLDRATDLEPPLAEWTPKGKARICGRDCAIFEWRRIPTKVRTHISEGGRSIEGDWPRTLRAWIDRGTGLVLRGEEELVPQAGYGIPTSSTVIETTRIKFLRATPPGSFDLPKGSTAYVQPEHEQVPVPAGVRVLVIGKDVHTTKPSVRKNANGTVSIR
jgi:hypothetical protein